MFGRDRFLKKLTSRLSDVKQRPASGYPSLGGPERSVFIDYNGPNPGNPSVDWECIAQNTSQNTLGIWYGGVCAFPTGNDGRRYEVAKLRSIVLHC
jgi:hypothetical protein